MIVIYPLRFSLVALERFYQFKTGEFDLCDGEVFYWGKQDSLVEQWDNQAIPSSIFCFDKTDVLVEMLDHGGFDYTIHLSQGANLEFFQYFFWRYEFFADYLSIDFRNGVFSAIINGWCEERQAIEESSDGVHVGDYTLVDGGLNFFPIGLVEFTVSLLGTTGLPDGVICGYFTLLRELSVVSEGTFLDCVSSETFTSCRTLELFAFNLNQCISFERLEKGVIASIQCLVQGKRGCEISDLEEERGRLFQELERLTILNSELKSKLKSVESNRAHLISELVSVKDELVLKTEKLESVSSAFEAVTTSSIWTKTSGLRRFVERCRGVNPEAVAQVSGEPAGLERFSRFNRRIKPPSKERIRVYEHDPLLGIDQLLSRFGLSMTPKSRYSDVKPIAFYLPQFHPIPENDLWWGKGFTEWRNSSKAKPLFDEHYQPHIPGELGYYDLRLPEVIDQQISLAKENSIYGFCFHYYWFAGKRLLEKPLDLFCSDSVQKFPFCLCWANENWSRRWDGSENELLIKQQHSVEDNRDVIRDLLRYFLLDNYIKVNGKPLIIIYRADIIPDFTNMLEIWNDEALEAGLPGLEIVLAQSFDVFDPRDYGVESAVEFPPHGMHFHSKSLDKIVDSRPSSGLKSYLDAVLYSAEACVPDFTLYRTCFPSWDNTARKGADSLVFHGANPDLFLVWFNLLAAEAFDRHPEESRYVFVNAWNEWAEGAHLEPDLEYGRGFLDVIKQVIG